jgi:hypothetical protein
VQEYRVYGGSRKRRQQDKEKEGDRGRKIRRKQAKEE